jgi:metal-dependent amidase/aminoacylase/carboxypeptidase family protein
VVASTETEISLNPHLNLLLGSALSSTISTVGEAATRVDASVGLHFDQTALGPLDLRLNASAPVSDRLFRSDFSGASGSDAAPTATIQATVAH